MELDFVKTELQKFNVADAVIFKMSTEYMPLKVKGLDDKEGLKKVHDARMVVKGKRLEVEKKRKELKESSLRFGQAVDGEAKRICALLSPIEAHLENEESIVEKEKERLRLEAEQKEQEKARIAEQERLAEIERQRKAEEERLAIIRKELEVEKERQAEVSRQQIEAENKIRVEQKKVEDEKRLIAETKLKDEQEKKRLADLEKAKVEAERQAGIEAARQEALKPDKEKLLNFAVVLDTLKIPAVSNLEVVKIVDTVRVNLGKISSYLIASANKL